MIMRRVAAALLALLLYVGHAHAGIINSLPFTLTNGTTADATQVMADFNQIVNNANSNAAHSGANSDITSILGLTTPLAPGSGGTSAWIGGTSAGTNTLTLTNPSPNGFAYTTGYVIAFTVLNTNTSAVTLSINALGPKNVFRQAPGGPVALAGGEMVASSIAWAIYDGTQFVLINNNTSLLGTQTNLLSAATTDLGTISTHNISITSTNTITAFGSTATTKFPVYVLEFAGILTLTNNNTSLILPGAANITTAANDTAIALYLGSGNWQVLFYQHAAVAPQTGELQGVQYFVANGTYTTPAGVNSVLFQCAGGGGGGAGLTNPGAANVSIGGGGGAGGWAQLYKITPAATYAITMGTAGTGSSGSNGGNGGNTTVGAILTCNGGVGGKMLNAFAGTNISQAGTGGTATSGDLNETGSGGGFGFGQGNGFAQGGNGGSNNLGAGAAGAYNISAGTNVAGTAATICGGGGSGAAGVGNSGASAAGGAGAAGCVIAYSYY